MQLKLDSCGALQAHTFLEIIQCRWGTRAHLVFMFIAFMTNFIVTIMMIMGAVVATHVLTGVNSYGEAHHSPVIAYATRKSRHLTRSDQQHMVRHDTIYDRPPSIHYTLLHSAFNTTGHNAMHKIAC